MDSMRHVVRTVGKYHAIEHAVYQVAKRTRQYQGATNNKAPGITLLYDIFKKIKAKTYCRKAEQG
jgi:hypothetical protein